MFVGLDIGRQYVKAVLLERIKGGYKVLDAGSRSVPDSNKAYDPEKVNKTLWVMAIKELLRQMRLKPNRIRNLVTAIGGSNISIKQISTLEMPANELYSAMTFEARKHIAMDGTDAVIDFQILGANPTDIDKIDVALVACTKKVLSTHMEVLKDAGLKPGWVDADPIALSNAFFATRDLPEDGVVVLIDVGAESTSLVVRGKTDPYFTRDIPIGSYHFVRAVSDARSMDYLSAQDELYKTGIKSIQKPPVEGEENSIAVDERTVFDNFVEDIRRTLRYYAKTTNQSFFLKIFLSGGASTTAGLALYIQEKLNIEVALFHPLEKFTGVDKLTLPNPQQYAIATGLAIRGGLDNE